MYTVYRNSGLTDVAGTITTDAEGYGKLEDLEPGELLGDARPSRHRGMRSTLTVYKTEVVSDETTRVNGDHVSDIPQSDPVGMLLGKVDATTNASRPQGSASARRQRSSRCATTREAFRSAQAAEASGAPARTWVFETDSDGFAYLADEYKYSGDALFHQTNGDASIPLGTVLIQETRAPLGLQPRRRARKPAQGVLREHHHGRR